jgi:hypothetical protein
MVIFLQISHLNVVVDIREWHEPIINQTKERLSTKVQLLNILHWDDM